MLHPETSPRVAPAAATSALGCGAGWGSSIAPSRRGVSALRAVAATRASVLAFVTLGLTLLLACDASRPGAADPTDAADGTGAANACGGTRPLSWLGDPASPGELCGTACSTLACQGTDSLECRFERCPSEDVGGLLDTRDPDAPITDHVCSAGGPDSDGDGICDRDDNCDHVYNPTQDPLACRWTLPWMGGDPDGDGVPLGVDHCEGTPGTSEDLDGDGLGDGCPCELGRQIARPAVESRVQALGESQCEVCELVDGRPTVVRYRGAGICEAWGGEFHWRCPPGTEHNCGSDRYVGSRKLPGNPYSGWVHTCEEVAGGPPVYTPVADCSLLGPDYACDYRWTVAPAGDPDEVVWDYMCVEPYHGTPVCWGHLAGWRYCDPAGEDGALYECDAGGHAAYVESCDGDAWVHGECHDHNDGAAYCTSDPNPCPDHPCEDWEGQCFGNWVSPCSAFPDTPYTCTVSQGPAETCEHACAYGGCRDADACTLAACDPATWVGTCQNGQAEECIWSEELGCYHRRWIECAGRGTQCGWDTGRCEPRRADSCGDGVVDAGEGCDDGNLNPGDGCSAGCTVETGFECETTRQGWSDCAIVLHDATTPVEVCSVMAWSAYADRNFGAFNPATDSEFGRWPIPAWQQAARIENRSGAPIALHVTTTGLAGAAISGGRTSMDPESCGAGCMYANPASPTFRGAPDTYLVNREATLALSSTYISTSYLDSRDYCVTLTPSPVDWCEQFACDPATGPARCAGNEYVLCEYDEALGCGRERRVSCLDVGALCVDGAAGPTCVEQTCGNGVLDGAEECDDGNLYPSDGCDHTCALEAHFVCALDGARTECVLPLHAGDVVQIPMLSGLGAHTGPVVAGGGTDCVSQERTAGLRRMRVRNEESFPLSLRLAATMPGAEEAFGYRSMLVSDDDWAPDRSMCERSASGLTFTLPAGASETVMTTLSSSYFEHSVRIEAAAE
ncbi:MAG: DUF4215 domain-containing protein [Myxococcales bacterium]|nr:DUF4215 domain-containing protein [Myxococcales bacterium]